MGLMEELGRVERDILRGVPVLFSRVSQNMCHSAHSSVLSSGVPCPHNLAGPTAYSLRLVFISYVGFSEVRAPHG
jgi:hypothetical protein